MSASSVCTSSGVCWVYTFSTPCRTPGSAIQRLSMHSFCCPATTTAACTHPQALLGQRSKAAGERAIREEVGGAPLGAGLHQQGARQAQLPVRKPARLQPPEQLCRLRAALALVP